MNPGLPPATLTGHAHSLFLRGGGGEPMSGRDLMSPASDVTEGLKSGQPGSELSEQDRMNRSLQLGSISELEIDWIGLKSRQPGSTCLR